MKRILLTSAGAGLLLCAAGIMTAQAQNTYITFSVDMSSNLVAGTFNPAVPAIIGGNSYGGTGTDTVYARGIFDGWANPGFQLFQVGNSGVYTNTTDDNNAPDQSHGNMNWQYDAIVSGSQVNEGSSDYANRMAYLPAGNNASLVLPTAFFDDRGPLTTNNIAFQVDMSEAIQLGQFHPSSGDFVVVAGSYQNFVPASAFALTNNPNIVITNNNFFPPILTTNVWTGTAAISTDSSRALATVNCGQQFKYVIMPEYNWDSPLYPNQDPDSGNRFYTMTGDQTLPLVNFNDSPLTYLATVRLNVDMSVIAKSDVNFEPGTVSAWGTFNGWSGPVNMTNNPAASNTNLYKATISMSEGIPYIVQFRYTNSFTGVWVYDYGQDGGPSPANNNNFRHNLFVPITSTLVTTNFGFYFNDISTNDVLPVDMAVQFSVDMNGAVGNETPTPHVFDPNSDDVYINGMFAGSLSQPVGGVLQNWYAWSQGANPVAAPPGYQMIEVGSTTVYTNTIIIPAGTPVGLSYQYGIDIGRVNGGGAQDEAAAGSVHYRAVRSTQFNPYVMPTDTFRSAPYEEPFFSNGNIGAWGSPADGNLTVGAPVAGHVPVSWLGRPGARLQSASSINGPWQSIPATDGINWSAGTPSTNGFVSVTNWPASGSNTFFRLDKP